MIIDEKQLKGKPKKVGKLHGHDVFQQVTKGGLFLLSEVIGPKRETIGSGPHPGIARHVAMKAHPELEWTGLAKGDFIELEHCQEILPKYEALTAALRKREGSDK
jgi:hypothetical protein